MTKGGDRRRARAGRRRRAPQKTMERPTEKGGAGTIRSLHGTASKKRNHGSDPARTRRGIGFFFSAASSSDGSSGSSSPDDRPRRSEYGHSTTARIEASPTVFSRSRSALDLEVKVPSRTEEGRLTASWSLPSYRLRDQLVTLGIMGANHHACQYILRGDRYFSSSSLISDCIRPSFPTAVLGEHLPSPSAKHRRRAIQRTLVVIASHKRGLVVASWGRLLDPTDRAPSHVPALRVGSDVLRVVRSCVVTSESLAVHGSSR